MKLNQTNIKVPPKNTKSNFVNTIAFDKTLTSIQTSRKIVKTQFLIFVQSYTCILIST